MADQVMQADEKRQTDGAEGTHALPTFLPKADIFETKEGLQLVMEVPGVGSESVNVTLDKRVLTINATTSVTPPEGFSLAHVEYRDGNYQRSFTLSEAIDEDGIQASVRDGVLRVLLPKAAPEQARTIQVSAG